MNQESLGFGMVTNESDGEFCKIGIPICTIGLKTPSVLCGSVQQCLCFAGAESFPCNDDYVPACVCALYGWNCAPKCGCCSPAPPSIKLKKLILQGLRTPSGFVGDAPHVEAMEREEEK
jgi:hypothetical protein